MHRSSGGYEDNSTERYKPGKSVRAWRKLYATILDSDQVSALSDGAAFLLCLLIVAQDDTGYWPWTQAKVRHLIACRPGWTHKSATSYAEELVREGIAKWAEAGIVLLSGEALNGRYRSDNQPVIYSRTPLLGLNLKDTPSILEVSPRVEERKSRGEKEKEERKSRETQPPPQPLSPDFLSELAIKYPTLDITSQLENCAEWCAEHKKPPPGKLRLKNWLENEIRYEAERKAKQGGDNGRPTTAIQGEPEAEDTRWGVIHSGPASMSPVPTGKPE